MVGQIESRLKIQNGNLDENDMRMIVFDAAKKWLYNQIDHWQKVAADPKKIKKALGRKNPHLRKLLMFSPAVEFQRHIDESSETDFGTRFYETMVAKLLMTQECDSRDGQLTDFIKRWSNTYLFMSIKSGPHAFNSSSRKKQIEVWQALVAELEACGFHSVFIIGYGRSNTDGKVVPIKKLQNGLYLHGSALWNFLTGNRSMGRIIDSVLDDAELDDTKIAVLESMEKAVEAAKQVYS